MKLKYLALILLFFCACKTTKVPKDTPNDKRMKPLEVTNVPVVPLQNLAYSVVVYTYDMELLKTKQRVIDSLNAAFADAHIVFSFDRSIQYNFPEIDDLTKRSYKQYYDLTDELDFSDQVSIWIVPSGDICDMTGCSSTKGFSNINGSPANIVLTQFGWLNTSVAVHEFGHWFGLDHTTTDTLDDTPEDPGYQNSVYISYDDCEMFHPDGYKPMIENYMAYYEHCPRRNKKFTPMQIEVIMDVARNYKMGYAVR